MIPSFLKEFEPISPFWLPQVPSHVSPRTLLILPRATVFFQTWPNLALKYHVSLAPLQRDLIPLQWAQVASGNHVIPRKLGQLFFVGHCHFHSFFSLMKVI
jgi:hypothetical protein